MIIELVRGDKKDYMSLDMFVRWGCLIDAIDVISEKCEQLKIDKEDDTWINPGAIEKYITARFPSMRYNIACELKRPAFSEVRPDGKNILPDFKKRYQTT